MRAIGAENLTKPNIAAATASVELDYRVREHGGAWEDLRFPVRLDWTPCYYGGHRPWWLCPAAGCGRRVAVLYGGRVFACRHCHGLAYTTQRESAVDRQLTRADKIRRRLGGEPGAANPFPPKPKGMHWRTYERLREQAAQADLAFFQECARRFGF